MGLLVIDIQHYIHTTGILILFKVRYRLELHNEVVCRTSRCKELPLVSSGGYCAWKESPKLM